MLKKHLLTKQIIGTTYAAKRMGEVYSVLPLHHGRLLYRRDSNPHLLINSQK